MRDAREGTREVVRVSARRSEGKIKREKDSSGSLEPKKTARVSFLRRLGLMRPSGGRHARDAAGAVPPLEASRAKSQGAEVGRVFGRARPRAPATRGAVSDARISPEGTHLSVTRGSRTEGHVEREELRAGRGPDEAHDRGDADGTSGGFDGSDDAHDAVTRAS